MARFVPWSSQPLDKWAGQHAVGKFIELNGHSTHYIEQGSGDPIILIHGFFNDSFTWHNNIDTLAERFKVFVPDLWGFGYSTRAPLDYGYALYADQILKFIDALDIPKASLVGHSMGGGTSMFFTAQHRDRVNKLLLVDSAGMPNPLPLMGKIANLPGVGEFLYSMNNNLLRRITLQTTWIRDNKVITDEYLENVTRFHKIEGTTEIMLKILRKQFFHTLADEVRQLGTMDVPTLIVWGRHDKSIPLERGQEMHGHLQGSRLEILEQSGHCPHDEQPDKFNQLAIEFLAATV